MLPLQVTSSSRSFFLFVPCLLTLTTASSLVANLNKNASQIPELDHSASDSRPLPSLCIDTERQHLLRRCYFNWGTS